MDASAGEVAVGEGLIVGVWVKDGVGEDADGDCGAAVVVEIKVCAVASSLSGPGTATEQAARAMKATMPSNNDNLFMGLLLSSVLPVLGCH